MQPEWRSPEETQKAPMNLRLPGAKKAVAIPPFTVSPLRSSVSGSTARRDR